MHDDQVIPSGLTLTLTGNFDNLFLARLAEAASEIAEELGKEVNACRLTPLHVLLVLSNRGGDWGDGGGAPKRGPTSPAGPAVELQHGVDRLVERASC